MAVSQRKHRSDTELPLQVGGANTDWPEYRSLRKGLEMETLFGFEMCLRHHRFKIN